MGICSQIIKKWDEDFIFYIYGYLSSKNKDKVYKILDKDTAKELRKIIITLYQYQNGDQNKTEYITKLTKKKELKELYFIIMVIYLLKVNMRLIRF